MRFRLFLIVILVCCCYHAHAQKAVFRVRGFSGSTAYLSSITGEKATLIDSAKALDKVIFEFSFNPFARAQGLYRLSFSNFKWLDFVYDGREVVIETDFANPLDSVTVLVSESNQYFYSFARFNKLYKTKSELLQLVKNRYPEKDDFYIGTVEKLKQIAADYATFIKSVNSSMRGSFVARYISNMQTVIPAPTIQPEEQLQYLKFHGLDYVDFNDAGLINSDAFSNKTIEYLSIYRNPQLPKTLLEKEFSISVDSILSRAKINAVVYKHVVQYLLDGFKKFGFETVLDYILNNYVIKDDLCLDAATGDMVQRRIEQAKKLPIGGPAPEIVLPDSSGKLVSLTGSRNEKTLVVFYATWCPHCKELLPRLSDLLPPANKYNISVFAVALDTSRNDWVNFIIEKKNPFQNLCDFTGWNGKAVGDYYIYATPSMFLIDKNNKILGKPISYDELVILINK